MKKLTAFLLALTLVISSFGNIAFANPSASYTIWFAPNTMKITKMQMPESGYGSVLKFEAAKNEYEGGQLIISAKSEMLNCSSVSVTDLVYGNSTIPSQNVKIYLQHYINVTEATTRSLSPGWYPDALIPVEKAGNFDVKQGENQGLWFTVYVPKGTAAGTYTGEVSLNLGSAVEKVPVQLKVWDFELTDESHSKTAFAIWPHMLKAGHPELQENTPEHEALYKNYYDFLLDYRITPTDLPIFTKDPNQYAAKAKEILRDPRITAYNIPHEAVNYNVDFTKLSEMISTLDSQGLLSKAYCYFGGVLDEKNPNEADQFNIVKTHCDELKKINPSIPNIITITSYPNVIEKFGPLTNNLTAILTHFSSDSFVSKLNEWRKTPGNSAWWYTCVDPKNPYPSYHIDDNLAGARILSWMQKHHGIEGNLYWCTNIFKKYDGSKYIDRDVWSDPKAFPGANGDGFLLYPGAKYGIFGPIGTVRLEAIRDGNEDYEYLWLLEQKLNEYSAKSGVEIKLDDYLSGLYSQLFNGVVYTTEADKLEYARRAVAEQIEVLNSGAAGVAAIKNFIPAEGKADLEIYAGNDTSVKVNGEALSGGQTAGNVKQYIKNLVLADGINIINVEFERNGVISKLEKICKVQKEKMYNVEMNYFEEPGIADKMTNDSVQVVASTDWATQGQKSLKVTYPVAKDYPELSFSYDKGTLNHTDLSKFKTLEFDVRNESNENARLVAKFFGNGTSKDGIKIIELEKGSQQHVVIDLNEVRSTFDISNVTKIALWQCGSQPPVPQTGDVTLLFDNFYFTANKPYGKNPPVNIKQISGNVAVDGSLNETCWELTNELKHKVSFGGEVNNTAKFGVVWNNDYLYFGFDIVDNAVICRDGNVWDDDSVEVFIDGSFSKGERSKENIGKYPQFTFRVTDDGIYLNGVKTDGLKNVVLQKSKVTANGYSMEIAVPWSFIGTTLGAGSYIALTAHVNDKDSQTGITDTVLGYTESILNDVPTAANWADFILSSETIVVPEGGKSFEISNGVLERGFALKAQVDVAPVANRAGKEVVVFQLMDGETVAGITAVEKDIAAKETFAAYFTVEDPNKDSYKVRVFVFDRFDGEVAVPSVLAECITLQ